MSFGRARDYTRQLLTAYSAASEPMPPPDGNYSRVDSTTDVGRLVQLCDCGAGAKTGRQQLTGRLVARSTRTTQPSRARCAAQLGVGGSPRASKSRVRIEEGQEEAGSLPPAQEDPQLRLSSTSSYEQLLSVRCCEGWDCPKPMCEDGEERAALE